MAIGCYHDSNSIEQVNISDTDILYEHNVMTPDAILRVARLSLLARVLVKAPSVVTSLIADLVCIEAETWPKQILADPQWYVYTFQGHLSELNLG